MPVLVKTLTSYVPRLITRRIAVDQVPITTPLAERFPAAVLFTDISGFTPLTEHLARHDLAGVEALSHILNDYFGQLTALIAEHGGDVVKFAGDALLAIATDNGQFSIRPEGTRFAQRAPDSPRGHPILNSR